MVLQVLGIVEGEQFVQLLRVLLPDVIHSPSIAAFGASVIQRILGFLASFFESKMPTGELREADPSLSAQVFVGSVIGFVLRRQIIRDPVALVYTHEQIVDAVIET